MCGRYITPDEATIERDWSVVSQGKRYLQSFNLAPTQTGIVAIETEDQRDVVYMTWAFRPRWSDRNWINARSETVLERRAFKSSALRMRCLVIAAGWYEWSGDKQARQPHFFGRVDDRTIAFAGIWTERETSYGSNRNFAILTTAANEWVEEFHHRMPLIVHPRHYDAWLSTATREADIRSIIEQPFDDGMFEAYPVSTFVNSPKNNSRKCIERVTL